MRTMADIAHFTRDHADSFDGPAVCMEIERGRGLATEVELTPDEARALAIELTLLADAADPKVGKSA